MAGLPPAAISRLGSCLTAGGPLNKIKYAFLALLCLPSLASATKIVSQQTGDAKDPLTWVGGVVPGIGDEVSLFHTVNATDTWTFGASLSSGSFALNLNSTGTLHITSTGKVFQRGYGTYTSGSSNHTDAVDVDGGGDWAFDASASTSPTTLHYGVYPSGSAGYRKIKISGSSSAYATVYNVNPSTVAYLAQNGQADGGQYELLYTSAVRMRFDIAYNNALGSQASWDAQHSSFTNCDVFNMSAGGNMFSSATFRHEYNFHQGSVGNAVFNINMTSKKDVLGTRSIKGNIFDITMTVNSSLGLGDFTIQDNFMNASYSAGQSSYSLLTNNFIRMTQTAANMGFAGTTSDSYVWWDDDQQNPHVFGVGISSNMSMSGMIWGQSGRSRASGADDSGEFYLQGGPGRISTTSITNCILLPNGAGYSSLQITSLLGSANPFTYLNNRADIDHNTYFGGWDNTVPGAEPPFSAVNYSESSNMAPGTLDSFRSNLLWNTQFSTEPANYFKMLDAGNVSANLAVGYGVGPTQDVCTPSRCDYNGSYGVTSSATFTNSAGYLNQGRGYIGNYSSTPGVHDVDAQNPRFLDYRRNVETFDSKYWRPYYGIAQPSAWLSGATYSQGAIVSHSSSTYYWGESINYVYLDTGSCLGANPEPGVIPVRSWEKCWKFESIEDIKHAIVSSTTFTDSAIGASNSSVNQTLLKWVRAGYAPSNTAFRGTAHDGGDIGAVSVVTVSSDPLNAQYFPTVNTTAANYSTAFGTITVTDSLYKIRRSSVPAATSPHWYTGYAMKNEIQSLQVHVSPATNIASLSVSMSNLVDSQTTPSSVIYATSTDIVVYREYYLNIATPTCLSTITYNGGMRDYYPDILIPAVDPYWHQTTNAFPVPVLSTQTQSAWIDVHIPTNAPSGYYSGSVYVSSGGVVVSTLPVVFGVWNWLMPSTATLAMGSGSFAYNGMCDVSYGGDLTACAAYTSAGGSDNANTLQWLDGTLQLLDNRSGSQYPANAGILPGFCGSCSFARYINGVGPLINGAPVRTQGILPGAALSMVELQESSNTFTAMAQEWLSWESTFTQQGWIGRLHNKLVDEPAVSQWPGAISTGTASRSWSTPIVPNLVTAKLADAVSNSGQFIVDNYTPIIEDLDPVSGNLRSTYDPYLAISSGVVRKVGSYQDCESAGTCSNGTVGAANAVPYPNHHIDGTPVANRAFETWAYLNNLSYQIYYGIDECDTGRCASGNPWASLYYFGGNGDGTMMVPSSSTYVTGVSTPIWCPTMRLKYYRDGEQDYEYENYLTKQGSGTLVSAQIASWMTNGHSFSNTPAGLEAARIAMGNAIHALSYTPVPTITSTLSQSLTLGDALNYQITASNTPTTYNATSLPAGVSVNTATGQITGAPTSSGVSFLTISATNANGTGQDTLTILVSNVPTVPPVVHTTESLEGKITIRGQVKHE